MQRHPRVGPGRQDKRWRAARREAGCPPSPSLENATVARGSGLQGVAGAVGKPHFPTDPVLRQVHRVVRGGQGGGIAIEVEGSGRGLKAHGLALGVGHPARVRPFTHVGARLEGAGHAVVGVRELMEQDHAGGREGVHVEGRVVAHQHVRSGACLAVPDLGIAAAHGLGIAVLLVGELADGHRIALPGGGIKLGQHLLAGRRSAQEIELGLHPLLEALRAGHHHAAAQLRVDLDVDHRGYGAAAGVDQVVDGCVDDVVGVRAVDLCAAVPGVHGIVAADQVDLVVAGAGGDDVLSATAVDDVVAATAVDVVEAAASVDLVVAPAAEDHVGAVAAVDDVVAAAAVDVVAAASGLDEVVPVAGLDAVVALAGDDVVVAGAGIDHHVDGDVGRGLDDVVAITGADGQLLALGQAHFVDLAVDVDVQGAVVALADLDVVVALAGGGEHHLVAADVRAEQAAGLGLLAGHGGLVALVQFGVADGLAVRRGLVWQAGAGVAAADGDGAVRGAVTGRFDRHAHVAAQRRLGELVPAFQRGAVPVLLLGLDGGRRIYCGGIEVHGSGL